MTNFLLAYIFVNTNTLLLKFVKICNFCGIAKLYNVNMATLAMGNEVKRFGYILGMCFMFKYEVIFPYFKKTMCPKNS